MLLINGRDCTGYQSQITELRDHWLLLVRREGQRKKIESGEPTWRACAVVTRGEALSGEVFLHEQGMLSFLGYRVGRTSDLTTMDRREILTYVVLGELPTVIDTAYTESWGKPNSPKRLIKLKTLCCHLYGTPNADLPVSAVAIDEWQKNFRYVHEAFG